MIVKSSRFLFLVSANSSRFSLMRGATLACAALLSACGGGGGGGGNPSSNVLGTGPTFQPSSTYAARCANPRSGIDPFTNLAYPDKPGSVSLENNWLRSWTHELYLWYREVPDANPSDYSTPASYFDVLKTTHTTATGSLKDRFHFTYPTDQWQALSQGGVELGYGAQWVVVAGAPPRNVVVAYTQPQSPAETAPLQRGARVLSIDGIDVVNTNDSASMDAILAALWPQASGESHTFTVLDSGAAVARAVTLTSANIAGTPVQNVQIIPSSNGLVGYLLFNDHVATAEQQLVDAISTLAAAGISDLVLDIRYNGGGYLDIANELSYMIAGPAATAGKTFEALRFNDQYSSTNPVTGQPLTPDQFVTTTQGFSVTAGQALPTLNLSRVFVLTGSDTCSASESIINSLRGVDVNVIQIGSTTCGKPYGFYPADNCGTTYFSIQFKGVNNKGFGDYADGFAPINIGSTTAVPVPGCLVADDFAHALGDVAEARLAAALNYRSTQACPVAASGFSARTLKQADGMQAEITAVPKSPWRENRILRSK